MLTQIIDKKLDKFRRNLDRHITPTNSSTEGESSTEEQTPALSQSENNVSETEQHEIDMTVNVNDDQSRDSNQFDDSDSQGSKL